MRYQQQHRGGGGGDARERERERGGGKRGIWRSADYAEQNEQLADKATKKIKEQLPIAEREMGRDERHLDVLEKEKREKSRGREGIGQSEEWWGNEREEPKTGGGGGGEAQRGRPCSGSG